MNEQKRNEILAFFWFIVSVLTLLALWSYTPDDIPFEVSTPNDPKVNFVGPFGAYIAWVLVLVCGRTSYFLIPLFLIWAFLKWLGARSQQAWLKIFSTVIFFASACALFSLIASATPSNRFNAGGLVGFYLSQAITSVFGKAGIFVALSLFILSIILASELLVLQAAATLMRRFAGNALPAFLERLEGGLASTKPAQAKAAADNKTRAVSKPLSALMPKAPAPVKTEERAKPEIKLPGGSSRETPAAGKQAPAPAPLPPKEEERSKPEIRLSIPKAEPPKKPVEPVKPIPRIIEDDEPEGQYVLPGTDLLQTPPPFDPGDVKSNLEASSRVLEDTLRDFGIEAKVVEVEQGPTITRYELQPAAGVKVGKITSLENDIALVMRATSVRIVAPIPGKNRVGIEVPNSAAATVYLREVLESADYQQERSKIAMVIGKDTAGAPLVCNLADMPHLLIAGATNTGKSVCINSIITSILFRSTPDEVRFLMIDPKMVELHFYNDLPHLICPVVTDKTKAPGALAWLVAEMERRYRLLSKVGAKNIAGFNEKVAAKQITAESLVQNEETADEPVLVRKIPYIVLVIDELADLMLTSAQEVETTITRLAQLARAVGIHMILATQRPSVDVITGVIKANFPARIAFQVASKVDSRTILDENGADKLLGRGDLLLMDPRKSKLVRAQGAWVQDAEIEKVTTFIKNQRKASFVENVLQQGKKGPNVNFKTDEMYDEAKRVVLESGQASVSIVQRRLGLGYTRAARLIDMMEQEGIVGPYQGSKARDILVERPKPRPEVEEEQDKEDL